MSRRSKRDVVNGVQAAQVRLGNRPKCMDLFTVPRVTPVMETMGYQDLGAFDIKNGWDARRAADRHQILHLIDVEEPEYVGMSPPCGALSIMQNLTADEVRRNPEKHRQATSARLPPSPSPPCRRSRRRLLPCRCRRSAVRVAVAASDPSVSPSPPPSVSPSPPASALFRLCRLLRPCRPRRRHISAYTQFPHVQVLLDAHGGAAPGHSGQLKASTLSPKPLCTVRHLPPFYSAQWPALKLRTQAQPSPFRDNTNNLFHSFLKQYRPGFRR